MSSGGAIVFLVVWIGLIVAGYYVGKSKGRVALGIILTVILGLIGLIIVACLPKTAAVKAAEAQRLYGGQPGAYGQYQGQGQYGQYQDPGQYGQYPQQGQGQYGQYPQQGQGQYGEHPQQGQGQFPPYPQQGQGQYPQQGQGQYPQQGQQPYPSSAPTQRLPVQPEQPPPPDQ
jgi:hypothetical protein